jgi:hypothetical protein
VKDNVQLPLFSHVTRVPESSELCNERLEWFNVREGHTFQNLTRKKCDGDQEPTKVELVALILHFTTVQF